MCDTPRLDDGPDRFERKHGFVEVETPHSSASRTAVGHAAWRITATMDKRAQMLWTQWAGVACRDRSTELARS